MDIKNKTCDNCRYFNKFYTKSQYGKLSHLNGSGACRNSNLNYKDAIKIVKTVQICELWEPEQSQIDERRENLFYTIKKMQEELEGILIILSDDYKQN